MILNFRCNFAIITGLVAVKPLHCFDEALSEN